MIEKGRLWVTQINYALTRGLWATPRREWLQYLFSLCLLFFHGSTQYFLSPSSCCPLDTIFYQSFSKLSSLQNRPWKHFQCKLFIWELTPGSTVKDWGGKPRREENQWKVETQLGIVPSFPGCGLLLGALTSWFDMCVATLLSKHLTSSLRSLSCMWQKTDSTLALITK